MWDDERIDAAIDDAAREMTAGEPGGDFRARVMARIEGRPRVAWTWRLTVAGVAAAVLIAVAVKVRLKPDATSEARPDSAEVRLKAGPKYERKPESGEVRLKPDTPHGTPSVRLRPDTPNGTPPVRLPPAPRSGFGGQGKADPTYYDGALTIAPVDLESIAVAALAAGDAIAIEPLTPAAPIAVMPLGPDNEGDRR